MSLFGSRAADRGSNRLNARRKSLGSVSSVQQRAVRSRENGRAAFVHCRSQLLGAVAGSLQGVSHGNHAAARTGESIGRCSGFVCPTGGTLHKRRQSIAGPLLLSGVEVARNRIHSSADLLDQCDGVPSAAKEPAFLGGNDRKLPVARRNDRGRTRCGALEADVRGAGQCRSCDRRFYACDDGDPWVKVDGDENR